ncbi:uncharacterized protein [Onthophagus taurus]|uniref:uncharacterized protein n=1 Tax=Onthophagus taurus TaxID=166361 RepID=UPI0039BDE797
MKFCVVFVVYLIVVCEGFYVHHPKKHRRQVRADETEITSSETPQDSSSQANVPECACELACLILCAQPVDAKRITHHKNSHNVNNKKHFVRKPLQDGEDSSSSNDLTQFLGCTCACNSNSTSTTTVAPEITQNPQEVNNQDTKKHHRKHDVKHQVFKKSHQ